MHKTGLAMVCVLVAAYFVAVPVANAQATDAMAVRGKKLYENRGCKTCHGIGKKDAGPDLMGLEQRRSKEWIYKWLKETEMMIASDSVAIALVQQWNGVRMPQQRLSDGDIDAMLAYVRMQEERIQAGK